MPTAFTVYNVNLADRYAMNANIAKTKQLHPFPLYPAYACTECVRAHAKPYVCGRAWYNLQSIKTVRGTTLLELSLGRCHAKGK